MEDGTGRVIDFKNTFDHPDVQCSGTEAIMQLAAEGKTRPDVEELSKALRPYLLAGVSARLAWAHRHDPVFPAVPGEMLGGIGQSAACADSSGGFATTTMRSCICTDGLVDYIVSCCNDPGFGRAHDRQYHHQHPLWLPDLAPAFPLHSSMEQTDFKTVTVDHKDGKFNTYELQ